jgi:hypothetical protein
MSEPSDSLREQFGDIDVYLFDQLLRGRIVSGMKVLDAGCGSGRNRCKRSQHESLHRCANSRASTHNNQAGATAAPWIRRTSLAQAGTLGGSASTPCLTRRPSFARSPARTPTAT